MRHRLAEHSLLLSFWQDLRLRELSEQLDSCYDLGECRFKGSEM